MRKIPAELKYTESHLWYRAEGDDVGAVGLTDATQMRLGDLISAELPRPQTGFAANDVLAYLEGMLESLEVEAFCNMQVLEVNPKLEIHPDIVNRDPYGEGWIFKVKILGVPRWMDAPSYADFLEKGTVTEGA